MLYVTDQRSFNVINSPIASVMSGRYLFYASEYLFLFAYYYVLFSKIRSVIYTLQCEKLPPAINVKILDEKRHMQS